jgi:phage-related protein
MPKTAVVVFAEDDGSAPVVEWLDGLEKAKARDKCIVRIERLVEMGHELRRPEADLLRDGIYELRMAWEGIQYRILYFFSGQRAVLSHGLIKRGDAVSPQEIDLALRRKTQFENNPEKHTYREWPP